MKSPKLATDNRFKKYYKSYLWNRTMLNFFSIVAAILKMETGRNFSMSWIISGHHNLPTYEMSLKSENVEFVRYCGCHFENSDRKKFSNVRNLFQDIIIYPHLKCRWNRTMLKLCGIVVAILKMVTARNFPMSGINSGHHNLST